MTSDVNSGYLLIADISGYTKFLAETELAHAKGILEDLFDAILPVFKVPVKISGLQGDAVFSYAIDDDIVSKQFILDITDKIYGAFAEKKDRIKINTTCSCAACQSMGDLDLKVFIHHGEFAFQKSGNTEELAGKDVITLFRLMKNDVVEKTGINAYALITQDAVNKMDVGEFFSKDSYHTASYEHIGEVGYFIKDLKKTWEEKRDTTRIYVSKEDDLLVDEATVSIPISPEAAFVMYSQPDYRQQIDEADALEIINKKGNVIDAGSQYHCHHGKQVFKYEILDYRPGEYMTVIIRLPMKMSVKQTVDFIPNDEGSIVKIRYSRIEYENLAGKMMSKVMTPKLQKMLAHKMEATSANLIKVSTTLLEKNPEIALGSDGGQNPIDVKEAVGLKLAS